MEVGEVPLRAFHDNIAYANNIGAAAHFHKLGDTNNAQSVIERLTLWNNEIGMDVGYANETTVRNIRIVQSLSDLTGKGVVSNDKSRSLRFENLHISGYGIGIVVPYKGNNLVQGGYFRTLTAVLAYTAVEPNRTVRVQGNIQIASIPASIRGIRKQVKVALEFDPRPRDNSIEQVFFADRVILNFGNYTNRRLYFREQVANFVPFPRSGPFIPAGYIGKTNLQLRAAFGKSIGGIIAPGNAQEKVDLIGLLGS